MTIQVKICGLRSSEMVQWLAQQPCAYGGFILATSRRQVAPEDVRTWIEAVQPTTLQFVGVVNDVVSIASVDALLRTVPLQVIQFHQRVDESIVAHVRMHFPQVRCWQVIGMSSGEETQDIESLLRGCEAFDALLLDTLGGGTGRSFAWETIPLYGQWAQKQRMPLYVAGGLTPENVGDLLERYGTWITGVDVSSGIEQTGEQSPHRIAQFLERVNGYREQTG